MSERAMAISFNDILNRFEFDTIPCKSTLYFTSKEYDAREILFEERLILNRARRLHATAVFFRRYNANMSSTPQIFIFDNTAQSLSEKKIAEIHRKIWSSGIVPIYYVFDRTEIKIYDGREPVLFENNKIYISPIDTISITSSSHNLFKKYSAKLFQNGSFWERKDTAHSFLNEKSAENKLINGLKKIRDSFVEKNILDKNLAHKILILSILVKYLEERKDENDTPVFPGDFFKKYNNSTTFCDIIRNGQLGRFFMDLSNHFNGKIFQLEQYENNIIDNVNLCYLADYLDADNENSQLLLWPLYSFEYLPVEVISRIYEEFIPKRPGAVYTPVHIARLMVDECMPINEPKTIFKLIDISCGSGVFLVTAFKRLVQWWQKTHYDQHGIVKRPKLQTLKKILKDSIYGIDIERDSVRLSVFSLSIALCDLLTPAEIWTELKFDDLEKKNILNLDFFEFITKTENNTFDLVIGNPPFDEFKSQEFKSLLNKYNIKTECNIPRHQIALFFLQKAMPLLKESGLLSLITPSSMLLYGNTLNYRKWLFRKYNVLQIIDCTNLSTFLFPKANVATAIIFIENKVPDEENILHLILKRTTSAKKKLFFEVDLYDKFEIPKEIAISEQYVWKANLLGGSFIYHILKYFDSMRSLGEFLTEKKEKSGWVFAEGYQRESSIKELNQDEKYRADYLTGKEMVPTKYFDENGIHKTVIEKAQFFRSPVRKYKKIFNKPHVLLKNSLGKEKLPVHFIDKDLGFMREIIGIYSPNSDKKELQKVVNTLRKYSDIYRFILASKSGRAGIDRSIYTLKKEDFMNLPYPSDTGELELSENEQIICYDVLKYKIEEISKGENSSIYMQDASTSDLLQYGKLFCDNLNTIYKFENNKFKPLTPISTISFVCYPFSYGNKKLTSKVEHQIKEGDLSVLIENRQELIHFHRVLKLYQKDLIFLIKPKKLRYWLKSIALRDANDVMIDLIDSGY